MKSNKFLIIKPTYQCNYNCTFCSSIGDNKKLNKKKLINFIENLCFKYNVDSVVNGGEPAIMSPNYYKDILNTPINSLSFQSNCELIYKNHKKWNYVLKHPKFGLGISFQLGCHRKNNNGEVFTTEKFLEYQDFFAKIYNKPLFFLSVMVNDNSNDHDIDKLMDIIRQLKTNMRISALTYSGNGKECYLPQYRTIQIYNYILEKHRDVIGYISPLIEFIKGEDKCSFSLNCGKSILNIEPDGNVYTCGSFGDRKIFKVGHIDDTIENIEKNISKINITPSPLKKQCLNCKNIRFCHSCYIRIDDVKHDSKEDQEKYCIEISKLYERIEKLRKIINSY